MKSYLFALVAILSLTFFSCQQREEIPNCFFEEVAPQLPANVFSLEEMLTKKAILRFSFNGEPVKEVIIEPSGPDGEHYHDDLGNGAHVVSLNGGINSQSGLGFWFDPDVPLVSIILNDRNGQWIIWKMSAWPLQDSGVQTNHFDGIDRLVTPKTSLNWIQSGGLESYYDDRTLCLEVTFIE